MKESIKPFLLFSVITAFWAATAQAAIDISFKNPERYTERRTPHG